MIKRDAEWYRQIYIEKAMERLRRSLQTEVDLEELEALKNDLLWEARAKRMLTPEGWKQYSARKNI